MDDIDAQIERAFERGVPPPRKLGRNEKCWCGSDKKYKRCHWATDRANRRLGKMSEILEDMAHTLMFESQPEEDPEFYRAAVDLSSLAWNISRLPEAVRPAAIADVPADILQELTDLVAYAETRWPNDPRMVARVEVVQQPDGSWNLLAASVQPG